MRLYALSDLHLGCSENREILAQVPARPDDWLIVAGDVGETAHHLRLAFDLLVPRFRQVLWVPGNHELWTTARDPAALRGVARYQALVDLCRSYGVLTPEDDYPVAAFGGRSMRLAPLFLLYDYSFRPPEIPFDQALDWARASGIECADEILLHPDPYPDRVQWCHARVEATLARLAAGPALPTVLINHFPLHPAAARLPLVPRFSLWCGTLRTADWHLRFGTEVVVYGHLHIRRTHHIDGIRFEEVSLGYPRQWTGRITPDRLLREILPGPAS
ncbi:MAG: metallophosphoesterase [Telmatospirillum sp.]|nr:metallophosphoesterase [Telmatospirillum sp.]